MPIKYPTALITGASSGIGEAFAKRLASSSDHLILVSRRGEELARVAETLRDLNPKLRLSLEVRDLEVAEDREELALYLKDNSLGLDLLINNAGLGDYGEVVEGEWAKANQMMEVNMRALTHLTYLLLPLLRESDSGGIINVSSLASVLPIPDFAIYAATKAYVTSFSEALRIENLEAGVNVTAVCPGPVHTNFGKVAARGGNKVESGFRKWSYVDKEKVVESALKGVASNKALVFPGIQVRAIAYILDYLWRPLLRLILKSRPRRKAKGNGASSTEGGSSAVKTLILGSASPRRKQILERLGYDFSVVVSDVFEVHDEDLPLEELCEINAGLKAKEVSLRYPDSYVIGSDTLVYHENKPIGKPKDLKVAKETLRQLSGQAHQVCSAVAIMKNGESVKRFHDVTQVFFKPFDDSVIDAYLEKVNVLDKAGSYAIQEHGELLVDRYEGEFDTVMGLPGKAVKAQLAELGILGINQ